MALIIKGNMPTKECLNCFDCQYLNLGETSYFNNRQSYRVGCVLAKFLGLTVLVKNSDELHSRPSDCPILGEIPDEHGDLIERSPLVQKIKDEWQKIHEETGYDVKGIFWNKLVEIIESSEVVLEAST